VEPFFAVKINAELLFPLGFYPLTSASSQTQVNGEGVCFDIFKKFNYDHAIQWLNAVFPYF